MNDDLTFEIEDIWKFVPEHLVLSSEAKECIAKHLQEELDRLRIMISEINPRNEKIISNDIRDLLAYLGYKICY